MRSARAAAAAVLLHAAAGRAAALPGAGGDDFRWPVPAYSTVTSTFGEYRRNHFHAGIDISSGDISGCAVLAARSGEVARIRIGPTGYGKMLEVRHPDGFTTAYAHLEQFAPALQARARAEQVRLERYPVDIACAPGEFPVAAGDVIAYTGQTGAASPHLHFEVRDAAGDPVNPFAWASLRVKDTIPPVIRRIAVIPLDAESTVDGSRAPLTLRASRTPRAVVVTGSVGLAVEGRDRIPGSRFQNGVYARTLTLDGKDIFAERMDRTPWHEAHEIELCYEQSLPGGGRFARLFVTTPNHLDTYRPRTPRAGVIDAASLAPGPHALRIVLADYAGNTAAVDLTLVAARAQAELQPPPRSGPPPPMRIACTPDEDGVGVRVTAAGEFTAVPDVRVAEGSSSTAVIMHRVAPGEYAGHFTPRQALRGARRVSAAASSGGRQAAAVCAIDVEPLLPFTAGTIALDGGALVLGYDSLSVLKPLFLSVTKETEDGDTVYRLGPENVILGDGITVTVTPRPGDAHAGLFARTTGSWQYIGGSRSGEQCSGRVRIRTCDVALLHDSTPPALLGVRASLGRVSVRFGDDLSGVEYDSLKMYIDGRVVIPEIDGRRHRAVIDARGAFARGPHQMTLRLTDRMGNTRTTVRRIVLR